MADLRTSLGLKTPLPPDLDWEAQLAELEAYSPLKPWEQAFGDLLKRVSTASNGQVASES